MRLKVVAAKRVLVVDDDPDIRHLISFQMKMFQFEPVEACNGRAALKLIEENNNFDLVITDASMPEMDGFGLAGALRSRPEWARVPILMVTSLDEMAAERASNVGVNETMGKPLDRKKFKATVHELLQVAA